MPATPLPTASAPAAAPSPVPSAPAAAPAIPTGIPKMNAGEAFQSLNSMVPATRTTPGATATGPQATPPPQAPAQPPGPQATPAPVQAGPAPAPATSPAPGAGQASPSPTPAAPAAPGQPGAAPAKPGEAPATPAPVVDAGNWWDMTSVTDLIKSNYPVAEEMFNQAGDRVKDFFSGEEGQSVVAEAQAGELSPPRAEKGYGNLANEVGPEAAKGMWSQMNAWDHALLWGGAGVGILGLANAMSGEGGIGSWIMGLLGMAGAAIPLASHGMFGQGAQEMVQGAKDMGGGYLNRFLDGSQEQGSPGPQGVTGDTGAQGQPPSFSSGNMGGFMKMLTDTVGPEQADKVIASAMGQYATPEQMEQLNRGAGVGGFGNKAMGWLGGLTGETDRQMSEYGFNPAQQERIFDVTRGLYDQQQNDAA